MGEEYNNLCKWCMRWDCEIKGGKIKPCPAERQEMPEEDLTLKNLKKIYG